MSTQINSLTHSEKKRKENCFEMVDIDLCVFCFTIILPFFTVKLPLFQEFYRIFMLNLLALYQIIFSRRFYYTKNLFYGYGERSQFLLGGSWHPLEPPCVNFFSLFVSSGSGICFHAPGAPKSATSVSSIIWNNFFSSSLKK